MVPGRVYGQITGGDTGTLIYQGTRYHKSSVFSPSPSNLGDILVGGKDRRQHDERLNYFSGS